MDKALYLGVASQKNSMKELEIITNNLANTNTPGFRADYEVIKQNATNNSDFETRVYPSVGRSYSDFKQGPVLRTENDLDIAISGPGFFSVQANQGKEGYTRNGNFEISNDGFLTTSKGEIVLGVDGAINLANADKVNVSNDGTVSMRPRDQIDMVYVGKLKLVNPDTSKIEKGTDGMFYMQGDGRVEADNTIRVLPGSLEGSNVSPVDTLIHLIDLSRKFEIQSNIIKNLDDIASSSNRLLDTKA